MTFGRNCLFQTENVCPKHPHNSETGGFNVLNTLVSGKDHNASGIVNSKKKATDLVFFCVCSKKSG